MSVKIVDQKDGGAIMTLDFDLSVPEERFRLRVFQLMSEAAKSLPSPRASEVAVFLLGLRRFSALYDLGEAIMAFEPPLPLDGLEPDLSRISDGDRQMRAILIEAMGRMLQSILEMSRDQNMSMQDYFPEARQRNGNTA